MKRIVLAAILAFCIASTLPAAPSGQSLLVQPQLMGEYMVYIGPITNGIIGWIAQKAIQAGYNYLNNNPAPQWVMDNCCQTTQTPNDTGGGGAW